ncbi:multicopper oxidase domain-containing protein [Nonomuraea sp. NPDC005983]|uniref:multicopper oxidase domain-containing protein n=1 Tax=Nonomuraea sp. NPDC005983 TaxID=3155595 RepID=UPI0033A1ADA9
MPESLTPSGVNRRAFLSLAALSGLAAACGTGTGDAPASPKLDFANPLHVPPLLRPERAKDGTRRFTLTLQAGQSRILPGKQTPTWGFNGDFLGPTLRAARSEEIHMTVRNQLGEATTVHWHGMRLPAKMDGGPHQTIQPGAVWTPHWTIDQPATTAWYHPHPHGNTAQHVYRAWPGCSSSTTTAPRTCRPTMASTTSRSSCRTRSSPRTAPSTATRTRAPSASWATTS